MTLIIVVLVFLAALGVWLYRLLKMPPVEESDEPEMLGDDGVDDPDPTIRALNVVSQQLTLTRYEVRATRKATDAKVRAFRKVVIVVVVLAMISTPVAVIAVAANARVCSESNVFRTAHNHLVGDTESVLIDAKKQVDASPNITSDQRAAADKFYQDKIDNFERNDKVPFRNCSLVNSITGD